MFKLKFHDLGEGINNGRIHAWHCKVGDQVKEGDVLLEVETDKMVAEISSPVNGVVTEMFPSLGDDIVVGDVLVHIEETCDLKDSK
ncbi:biotin/lipoyl-containing protein [Candidatus Phytoplasma melaleucae]|uniref:Biotin/lipoyl-binding protein n=1 Tax=Candidatus Phytoplasma melaleucae TaxID=2982630 RepID=A0ABT9DD92_9MOLU|nr:biotin/lipoyl-containing protein ['Melaleuca sp.' phytoplasma]MDO8168035.1 biotin/lipoyl-binding protein ['Melaleuca sp.' phytoplasma]MDV3205316.1 biotin/lipoyl-containing protein [Weeping tea tree witches'-broom phytoplasma]